jgi:hypothetical protein
MSFDQPKARNKRSGIDHEEERAWVGFYRRVRGDAALAAEVMAQLDADPEMKRRHLALYLCCKQSLRAHKARQQRDKRIGQFVRWVCNGMFVVPIRALQRGGQLAVECLPEAAREPAAPKVRKLARDPEFATAQSVFQQQAAASAAGTVAVSNTSPADSGVLTARKSA